jgi:GNAT superfamily N-acetyltransferase
MLHVTIVPAGTTELRFAHDVSRENMEKYYTAAGGSWDPAIFQASWPATENYSIFARDIQVGVLRLRADADAIYISDLQIAPGSQGRGAGTSALAFVERIARERGVGRIRLRAFTGSAAIRLYQRAGFRRIADESGKQLFEREL